MALITCPECGHEVSDTAETCPNCGYKLKESTDLNFDQPTKARLDKTIKEAYYSRLISLAIVFVGGLIGLFFGISRYQNVFQIITPIFVMVLSAVMFVYVYRKYNPRTHTKQEMFNTSVKHGRIALIIVGVVLILAGIIFTIVCWDIMTDPKYSNHEMMPFLYIYIGFYYLAGIASIIYYFIKKRKDF